MARFGWLVVRQVAKSDLWDELGSGTEKEARQLFEAVILKGGDTVKLLDEHGDVREARRCTLWRDGARSSLESPTADSVLDCVELRLLASYWNHRAKSATERPISLEEAARMAWRLCWASRGYTNAEGARDPLPEPRAELPTLDEEEAKRS